MMPLTEQSTMIGVFATRDSANQAIDNLRRAGLSYDQIRLVNQGGNDFVENVKSMFTGQATAKTDSADDWMRIGVPQEDANHYQHELDGGRSIVLLKSVPGPEQALSILHQCGAYELAFRYRTAPPPPAQGAAQSAARAETANPNVSQGTYPPPMPPASAQTAPPPPRQPVSRNE